MRTALGFQKLTELILIAAAGNANTLRPYSTTPRGEVRVRVRCVIRIEFGLGSG